MRYTAVSLAMVICACMPVAPAQWVHYPTAGVPRTSGGKPNLAAAAPRTADGKPDLSGMWWMTDSTPCPASLRSDDGDCIEKGLGLAGQQSGTGLSPQAVNIAAGVGVLPYLPWSADLAKRRREENTIPMHSACLRTLPEATRFRTSRSSFRLPDCF